MNRITTKIFFFGSLMLLAGCASCKSSEEEKNTTDKTSMVEDTTSDDFKTQVLKEDSDTSELVEISGRFNYSGNEPFARPTIFISGEKSYLLIGDENFIENEYKKLNGKKGVVFGKEEKQRYFKVYFYEVNEE